MKLILWRGQMVNKTVAIDFDDVISHYDCWEGVGNFGLPIEGVSQALKKLKSFGIKIIIHTTRGEKKLIEKYLIGNDIPFDHINHNPDQLENMDQGKPIADVYVDDRGVTFKGAWNCDFVQEIINFKSWHKK